MIRLLNEGKATEGGLIAESDDGVYVLRAADCYSEAKQGDEPHYEVYNNNTGVVESRMRCNIVNALAVLEAIVNVYQDYRKAGSVQAMDDGDDTDAAAPSAYAH